MENLNAEQVKSELEGLAKFRTCPEYIKYALALINSQEQRIKELTEENERLRGENAIKLPCKVGDTLYVISQMKDKRILPFINQYEVTSISLKRKSIVIYHEMDGYIKTFKQTDFGKTVFLTKKEAEKALKGK